MYPHAEPSSRRIALLDIARFLGLVLVYYGHIVEQYMYRGNASAALQYKWIYSFHMPFFFLISGYVYDTGKAGQSAGRFFKRLAASRLTTYLFFSLLLVPLTFLLPVLFPPLDFSTPAIYFAGAVKTAMGFPLFNIPVWFLGALVSVEILNHFVIRHLRTDTRLLLAALAFYLSGYFLNLHIQFFDFTKLVSANVWMLHEAPVVYAFYLIGIFLRRRGFLLGPTSSSRIAAGALVCLALVILTYDLNQGPFRLIQAVVILASGHGHIFWFPFTALAGSLLVLFLAKAVERCCSVPDVRESHSLFTSLADFTAFMGRNGLILFGLNGLFYHFANPAVAAWSAEHLPGNGWTLLLSIGFYTTASLLLCLPFILLFTAWVPQLVGRPAASGPLLPALIKPLADPE